MSLALLVHKGLHRNSWGYSKLVIMCVISVANCCIVYSILWSKHYKQEVDGSSDY